MKEDENSEKVKADISNDEIDDGDMLKKREDNGEQATKSIRVVMPSVPGPFISKQEFISLQKTELSEEMLKKYYERYRTMYREEEARYYVDSHQDSIWFSDLYNPFTGQKLEEIKLQNYVKKHNLFTEQLTEEWLSTFDIGLKSFTGNESSFSQAAGYKFGESVNCSLLNTGVRNWFGHNQYLIDGLPKDVSINEIWTQLAKNDWFWDLNTSLPVKHNNYTRLVYISRNPLSQGTANPGFASLEIGNYNFKVHEYAPAIYDVYYKVYSDVEVVKKDLNCTFTLINRLLTKHELSYESLESKLAKVPHTRKLSVLIYYLYTVWGINFISKSRMDKNTTRKRVLLTNAADFHIEDEFAYEQVEDAALETMLGGLSVEGSEDRVSTLVDKKIESKIRGMLEEYEEGVWPCPKCGKFFENSEYVIKHFNQKHPEKVEKYRSQLKIEVKSTDFGNEIFKDVLIGNYENKINFNPFKDAIVFREMERLKDKQALKLNYRWRYVEEY